MIHKKLKKRLVSIFLVWLLIGTVIAGVLNITDDVEAPPPPSPLIIGDDAPDENLTIENTTYHHYGEVILINQGEIRVKNAEFRVYGNIWAFQDSRITVNYSTFGFLSVTKWQFSINLYNVSELRVENSQIYSNLFANLLNPNDYSKVTFFNVTFTDWFSCKIADNSNIDVRDSYGPKGWASEFFFMDSATGYFSNITGIINVFCVFHDGSIIIYSPLWNESVSHFEFPADVTFHFWVNYSFVIDNCYIYGNSPLLEKGCNVTVTNCITSVIIRPTNDDQLNISGLVGDTYHWDWNAPLSDRQFRAVNSFIRNWHLHIFDYSSVNLVNSIFSEILCIYWNCSLYMKNTIYKGDAGPFWVFGESSVYAENCVFFAQDPWGLNPVVYVRDLATLALYNCYVYTDFTIEGHATVYLLNSETFREPLLLGSSVLWVAKINSPPTGLSNDSVPIRGSAYIDKAPGANTSFGSYRLYYAPPPSYTVFTPIGPERTTPVEDGVLEYWNTSFLTPAIYYLRMDLKDSNLTDNVSVYWAINIQRSDVLHNPPSEPLNPNAVEDNSKVELNWNPPANDGNASITNYTIYRGLTMGSLTQIAEIGNLTRFIDENVTPGTTYFYKVSAKNKMGEGPLSDLVFLTTSPLVDLSLTTSDITFSNSTPTEDMSVTIYGNIQAANLTQPEMVWVELEIDGIPIEIKPVSISSPSTQIQFNWTSVIGNHDITLNVDIIDSIAESNEFNNIATKQITVTEKKKPDLTIDADSITFSNNAPIEGELVFINATIDTFNFSENISVIVEFLIDDNLVDYSSVSISGTSTNIQFTWTCEGGTHDVKIKIDTNNVISESNEANNTATKSITVVSQPQVDLEITSDDIILSSETPNEGEVLTVNATLHAYNLTENITAFVEFFVDDNLEGYSTVTISEATTDFQFNWICEEGTHDIKIEIDTTNAIGESDESNNAYKKQINVIPKPLPDLFLGSTDITFSNDAPKEGDLVTIDTTISAENLTEDVTLLVELFVGGDSKSYYYISITSPTTPIQFNWIAEKGDHTIEIKADTIDAVVEVDETNNIATKNLVVSEVTPPPPEDEEEALWPYLLIALVVVLIVIFASIAWMMQKNRRREIEEVGELEPGEESKEEIEQKSEALEEDTGDKPEEAFEEEVGKEQGEPEEAFEEEVGEELEELKEE